MLTRSDNVLVVVAHPDDEVLGCGGTIARLAFGAGRRVLVAICADGVSARPEDENVAAAESRWTQAQAAAAVLGSEVCRLADAPAPACYVFPDNAADVVPRRAIARWIELLLNSALKPSTVFTHSFSDLNVDHRRVHEAVRIATRPLPGRHVSEVLAFEVPSATHWGTRPFAPLVYVDIEETLDRKLAAMALYDREQPPFPHPRSPEALRALAMLRGSESGRRACEAFELVRGIY